MPEPRAKLNVEPPRLTFTYRQSGAAPPSQTLTVTVNGNHTIEVSAEVSPPMGWLSVSGHGPTPTQLTATVSPAGLPAGVYIATIIVHGIDQLNRTTQDEEVPVTLTVTGEAALAVTPSRLTFQHHFGSALPAAQQITVDTTTGVPIQYSVSTDQPWLRASGGGATPGQVSVSVTGLPIGTYNGNVVVTSAEAANSTLSVGVTFVVSPAPVLSAIPASLTFLHQQQTPAPAQATVGITVAGSPTALHVRPSTSAAAPWLQSSGGGATPAFINVSINPTGLAPGKYTDMVTVIAAEPGVASLQVPVTLEELAAPSLSASPQQLFFVKIRGSSGPPTQTVALSVNPQQRISFSANATTSSGGNWLSAQPLSGTAPGTLTVSAQPRSLGVGVYQGNVTVTSTEAANSPVLIPVTLTVEDAPAVQTNPQSLSFAYQALSPSAPPDQQLTVTTSNGSPTAVAATASTSSGGNWLSVPASGSVPGTLQVSVNPSELAAGSYGGTITITASGFQPDTVPVTLTVTAAPVLNVLPTALTFAYQEGGANPIAQTVSVTSNPTGIPFIAASDPWIHAVGGGTTDAPISVSVVPMGLAAGSYRGSVSVTSSQAGNSPVVVQVDLTITAAAIVTASPASLHFVYTQLGTVPAPQPVSISATRPIDFTVSVSSSTPWLSATVGEATPDIVTVTVDPTGLAPGDYVGSVLVDAPGAANTPLTIPVTMTVAAAPLIQTNPSQVTFSYQLGGAQPVGQTITITSGGAPVTVSATTSGEPWLSVAGNPGPTPAVFAVAVDASTLSAGVYNATVTVSSSGASNSPITVPVRLIVTAAPTLIAAPTQLSFSYQIGVSNPPNQQITITSSSGALTFSAAASTSTGGSWLTATGGGSTPSTVDVAVNAAGLAAGTYSGKVTLTSSGAGNSPLDIPVTLVVASAITLSASPANLSFNYQQGGARRRRNRSR